MNIAAIETFLAVYRTGHLNRAAGQLNITQSAVTARLDALEARLGARLLIRSRKGAELTKAGYAFLQEAELITRSWEAAQARLSLPRGVTRLCSLVVAPGFWTGLAAPWVEEMRADHPGTGFEVWTALAGDAARWLESGLSDAALLGSPLPGPDIASRLFATDTLVQVASRSRETMEWDPDYVFVDHGPAFRARHAETWPGEMTASLSFSDPGMAHAHLLAHGGSAYLPEAMVATDIAANRLYRVKGSPIFTRETHLSWRKASATAFAWLAG